MLTLFQLLQCRVPEPEFYPGMGLSPSVTTPAHPYAPKEGFAEWQGFRAEMDTFFQDLYSQQDTDAIFTNPVLRNLGRITNEEGVAANVYAWYTIPVQELSAEYERRYAMGAPLYFSWPLEECQYGRPDFVTFLQRPDLLSFIESIKGYFDVKRRAVLYGDAAEAVQESRRVDKYTCWRKMATQLAGYIKTTGDGLGMLTSLLRMYFIMVSRNTLYIGGPVDSSEPGERTVYEALFFFLHLILSDRQHAVPPPKPGGDPLPGDSTQRPGQDDRDDKERKRKFTGKSGSGSSSVEKRRSSRLALGKSVRSYELTMMQACQSAGFSFDEIRGVVKAELPMHELTRNYCGGVHMGRDSNLYRSFYRGRKCVVKTFGNPRKLRGLLVELRVLTTALRDLQGAVVPRVLTAGHCDGSFATVFEDIGGESVGDNFNDRRVMLKAQEGLKRIHKKGVTHGTMDHAHIIWNQSGDVHWIDFADAAIFGNVRNRTFQALASLEEEQMSGYLKGCV